MAFIDQVEFTESRSLSAVVPNVPYALRAPLPHVPCALHALVPRVSRALSLKYFEF